MEAKLQMDDRTNGHGDVARAKFASSSSFSFMGGQGTAFRAYSPSQPLRSSILQLVEKKSLVTRLTKNLVETYQKCNTSFKYSETLNPKRFLTNPSAAVLNDGHDNTNSDLVLYVNLELLNSKENKRYVVKDMLGQGTFGQVARCWDAETNNYVAVKVIKNQPAYSQQALVEVSILHSLNRNYDPDDRYHIVRILDYFEHHQHLCIAFEMLGANLFELLKKNKFKGLLLNYVQSFSKQILHALIMMKEAGIIHCDLKPENILISPRAKPPEIKVIDFGSACREGKTIYSYIQSRYYRSPEVLLGYPYTTAIDMWSFGCIVAELFLGLPLFPGASEFDLMKRMMEILGGQPPDKILREAKGTGKFFKHIGSIFSDSFDPSSFLSAYRLLTEDEFEARESKRPEIGKKYLKFDNLEDIITHYPYRTNLLEHEILKESSARRALIDFLRGLLEFDPSKRWSPMQALYHPFVTGEPFTGPYRPLPETPRIPVFHPVMVDHNPGGGHWVAAGLSPQVGNRNSHCAPYNTNSPYSHFPSFGTSYGSYGTSYGSYNNTELGTSYGSSFGDHNHHINTHNINNNNHHHHNNNNNAYYSQFGPGGFNIRNQVGGTFLGSSPDVRRRPQNNNSYNNNHHNYNNNYNNYKNLGVSPNFGAHIPLPLGASPSQFTPPGASPGKYGPTSPVRTGPHGGPHGSSSLGKITMMSQHQRRRNWIPGSSPSSYQEHHYPQSMLSNASSGYTNWRPPVTQGLAPVPFSLDNNNNNNNSNNNNINSINNNDVGESTASLPGPGDWDPDYSEESLLQEDNISSEMRQLSSSFNNGMQIGPARFVQPPQTSNYVSLNQRIERPMQGNTRVPQMNHRQQSVNININHNQMNNINHNQMNQMNNNTISSSASSSSRYSVDEFHPSAALLGNPIWGQRGGHSLGTTFPPRNEFGQIL
ncbi:hypothetical protein LUZ60_016995 [Juncus effusus]|nr:hypothetical protein LUZ60_016995 [Juncus effusus]